MKIEISSKNIDLLPSLTAYINEKMGMLGRHVKKFELEGELHLKIRVGRITAHHQKGDVFVASADLTLPGINLHAEKSNGDMHTAVDMVRDALVYEIEKHKEKREDKYS
jgi:ribosomal subunit interface protein